MTTKILAVVLAGASPLLAQTVADAIADLQRPELAVAACSSLQRQGIAAVMPLRLLLQQSRREGAAFDQGQLTMALYVLGRLGPLAVSALPEVQQLYRDVGPAALRDQALWALGELALGSGDLPTCRACEKLLVDQWTRDLDACLGAVVRRQLAMGPFPDAQELLLSILHRGNAVEVIAAARSVAAGRTPMALLRQRFWELLSTAMEKTMLPLTEQPVWMAACGDLALALADRGGLGNDPLVLRGLLRHWDPDRRRIALAQCIEHPDLAVVARAEVVPLLFDQDRAVRLQAARTCKHWGRRGLVSLLGLRLVETAAAVDPELAAACREAAEVVLVDARAGLQGKTAPLLLAELDGIARGRQPGVFMAFDPEAAAVWAEVVTGARVAPAAMRCALLDLGIARGANGSDAVWAAVAAMVGADRQVEVRGMQLLARLGKQVEAVLRPGPLLYGIASLGSRIDEGAFECMAWISAGADRSTDELRAVVQRDILRSQLRAVVELAGRGALPSAEALALVGTESDAETVLLWSGAGGGGMSLGRQRLEPARQLILGLCGAAGSDTAVFRRLVHERFAVPIDAVPGWVAEVRASGQLHQRLLEVEAMLRRDLKVDERIAPR